MGLAESMKFMDFGMDSGVEEQVKVKVKSQSDVEVEVEVESGFEGWKSDGVWRRIV